MSANPYVLHTRVITGVGGGPEKTILNSPRFLAEAGHQSACLFMHPPDDPGFGEILQRAQLAQAEVISVDDNGPLDWRVVRQCVRVCRHHGVGIWHAHDYKSNAIGLLVRRFHPMRLVTTVHGWVRHTRKTPLYYWIDRASLKRYDQVVCVSQDLFSRCQEMGIPNDKLSLIENGIVVEDYTPTIEKTAARRKFNVPTGRFLVGACGRLSEEKGFDLLIDAVRRLTEDNLDVGLLIAGEGHLEPTLQAQIRESGLEHRVQLVGFLSDPRELYQAIDLFALSSLREGLPNVVLEAMATGVPLLTTRVAGIPAVITHRQDGYIVEPDSADELTAGLRECITSDELRNEIAIAGKARVVADLSFGARMQKMLRVYDSLDGPAGDHRNPALTAVGAR